ncbi:YdcH family protein [Tateyamaria sp. syn59]|uniref:YdcH family protein n=1 Tax=Tateyamaria sp. syn59 TaxID=2576942 RepID=UPI0011BD963C|nr:YdcH family protein [Tateyamaria sp. syn59]
MSHTPHDLASDFPEHKARISRLRQNDAHFARLADTYDAINGLVHRAETDVEPMSDEHVQELRKKRMGLKDELYAILKAS